VVVYIHGGYWQRGNREEYSFVAEPFVARGAIVAIPSYSLCPEVGIADIISEMKLFLGVLWHRLRRRPVVIGHSAGGHLAAAMLASDWSDQPGVPADLVRSAYAISGVFDLPPLIPTSLNEALRLTEESARGVSPLFWPAPSSDCTLVAAVGGEESSEFIRQSRGIAHAWSAAGAKAEYLALAGRNHFTVLDELCWPDGEMLDRVLKMARV
jgi:arylformamidase